VAGPSRLQTGPSIPAESIHDAAVELFFERGYYGTSMREIADHLGVASASLYHYVPSKQALLREIMIGNMENLQREFAAATTGETTTRGKIRRGAEAHVRHHVVRAREAKIDHSEVEALVEPSREELKRMRRSYGRAWVELVEAAVADGTATCGSPKLTAFAILDMGIGVSRWFRPDGPLSGQNLPGFYGDFAVNMLNQDPPPPAPAAAATAARLER
jgi:AcrR family transcriptional regulator